MAVADGTPAPDLQGQDDSVQGNQVTKSIFRNGRFWNPWETWTEPGDRSGGSTFGTLWKFWREKDNSNIPSQRVS